MNTPVNHNVLNITGLTHANSAADCYLAVLRRLHDEFPRGYVEPAVLLHVLYGSLHPSAKSLFMSRLPLHAKSFFTIPWHTPDAHDQLCSLVSLLHACFANYPHTSLHAEAFYQAYTTFEAGAGG